MIYTISEYTASILECFILFGYLILSLGYKLESKNKQIISTLIASGIGILNIFIWERFNQLMNSELFYVLSYFLILFTFSLVALKGKYWHQILLMLMAFLCIYIANAVLIVVSGIILSDHYSSILLMRNPTRIFLLAVSKVMLISLLLPISNIVQKKKFALSWVQCVISTTALIVMIVAGVSIEKLILDEVISLKLSAILMCCIVTMCILLFIILILFSLHNKTISQRIALETRLNDEEVKLQETLQWSKSVKTLRHDLSNHLISISKYIQDGNNEKALHYITRITDKIDTIPNYINTDNPTINAILDLKRMICEKEGIDLKCYVEQGFPQLDDVAFCTIFGNLIDNAIEAEIKEEQKEIRLSLEMASDYLHIIIQNRIHNSILINGNLPPTTKNDNKNHGLGIYSVTEAVSQMNGAINFREENNWFIVDVLIQC